MGLSHNHSSDHKDRNLLISILLNSIITIAQIIGGFLSGSLALLSDALHNLTDVFSLIISYIASILSKKKATNTRTFGYKRAEIIAAFINASSLIIIAIYFMDLLPYLWLNLLGCSLVMGLAILFQMISGKPKDMAI